LAVTIFLLAINEIVETITTSEIANLFADDFNILIRSQSIKTVKYFLQESIVSLTKWSNNTGINFSSEKSQYILFSKKINQEIPQINIDKQQIPYKNKIKILGMIFDSKLSWLPHLKSTKTSILQKLNILKIISHTFWGGDTCSLLKIYRALIRSKSKYGSTIFRTANPNYLKMFDTPLNTGIRLALGGFKSSPIESLRNLANELPPKLRRSYNNFLYTARILKNIENPSNKYLTKNIKEAEEYQIDLQCLIKRNSPNFSPWKTCFDINLDISEYKKENTSNIMYRNIFKNTLQKYPNHKHIYTDASKTDQNVGISIVTEDSTTIFKLPPVCSIYIQPKQ
jgi:hypothetical protein